MEGVAAPGLQGFVFALFFIFGGITSLNKVVTRKIRSLGTLTYDEAMLVQTAFLAAYFVISLPAAAISKRIGYTQSVVEDMWLSLRLQVLNKMKKRTREPSSAY